MNTTTDKPSLKTNEIIKDFLFSLSTHNKLLFSPDNEQERAKLEAKIRAKLENGKRLSAEEMNYLKRYNPALYAIAFRVEMKRKNIENRLKNATSKEEVEQIQAEALGTIKKDDVAKQYLVAAVWDAVKEFKESKEYKKLPETEEEAKKRDIKKQASISLYKTSEKEVLSYEITDGNYQVAFKNEKTAKPFTAML